MRTRDKMLWAINFLMWSALCFAAGEATGWHYCASLIRSKFQIQ